ncbi:IS4 family transposase [Microcoleus sp. F8-D1]
MSIESLATGMPYPILFESRRRGIQRFLKLPMLTVEKLWFPLIKYILRTKFSQQKELRIAIDRTQWRDKNIFVISLIYKRRALPLYWQILPKKGCSNIPEQKKLINPVLSLLRKYKFVIIGEREFVSVKLGKWLCTKNVKFVLRIQKGRYIERDGEEYQRLSQLGLLPGTNFYFRDVKVTKQKGFGTFDIAGYWKRRYQGHGEDEGWYLLTNVGTFKEAVTEFRCRSGIEAMFKDCQTGGYNLEKSHACNQRLNTLILLIAFAYSCAIFQKKINKWGFKNMLVALLKVGDKSCGIVAFGLDYMVNPGY